MGSHKVLKTSLNLHIKLAVFLVVFLCYEYNSDILYLIKNSSSSLLKIPRASPKGLSTKFRFFLKWAIVFVIGTEAASSELLINSLFSGTNLARCAIAEISDIPLVNVGF